MKKRLWGLLGLAALALVFGTGSAYAELPYPWQVDFQEAVSPVMEQIYWLHNIVLLPLEVGITLFVLILMGYICWRFNAKRNPVPSKTTHNAPLEVLWTVIPIIILVVIAVPSMKLLFFMDKAQEPDMTLKVVGNQWYWSYEYPDHGNFRFDSNIIQEDDLKPGQPRLLSVDNHVVLPADTTVRLLFTATDVIHAWAIPSFGVKLDTVPGRINESWVRVPAAKIGRYHGQCSELCGVNHGFMPIVVDIVSKEDFTQWVAKAKVQFADNDSAPVKQVQKKSAPATMQVGHSQAQPQLKQLKLAGTATTATEVR
ncbi:MAG: cytochrome c oxidase subunit II [Proteobacteria bacterium]|nr:cytochrome c oxidase subunit II [Pseudomonadota bacterium]